MAAPRRRPEWIPESFWPQSDDDVVQWARLIGALLGGITFVVLLVVFLVASL